MIFVTFANDQVKGRTLFKNIKYHIPILFYAANQIFQVWCFSCPWCSYYHIKLLETIALGLILTKALHFYKKMQSRSKQRLLM